MPVKLRTEVRKEQIVQAAMVIAAEHGISGITTKRVAEHIGLAPSALYRHYPNRDAIIAAVLENSQAHMVGVLFQAMESEDPIQGLRTILMSIASFLKQHRAMPLFLSSEEVWHGPDTHREGLREGFGRYTTVLQTLLTRAKETGQARPDLDPWQTTILFIGLYVPPAMLSIRMPDKVDLETQIDHNWRCFLRAIAPE